MIVFISDKGKRTDKLLPATSQCVSGSYDIIVTLDKFIISQLPLLCQAADCTNILSVSLLTGERRVIVENKTNIEQAVEFQLSQLY